MTNDHREIHRKKRVLEYAERIGNINKACRWYGKGRLFLLSAGSSIRA